MHTITFSSLSLCLGFVLGSFISYVVIFGFRQKLDSIKRRKYYQEFLENLSKLTDAQFEKVLESFREFRRISKKN